MGKNKVISGIYLVLFIIQLLSVNVSSQMSSDNVVVAINCGGNAYTDSRGITYEKDNYFSGGQESDFGMSLDIKLTDDIELYQSERWAGEDLHYDIPISQSGKYALVLKFSEVYFNSPGEKVFDIMIGGETVLKEFDIYAKVGKATAYDEFIEFELKDNQIFLKNKPVEGAYNERNGTVRVTFKKGRIDNPKINSIVLVKGTLTDTDFLLFKSRMEDFEKQRSEKDRKQREFKKISTDYDYEDFEDDFVDVATKENGSSIVSLSYLILWGVLGYSAYVLFFKKRR